MYLTKKIFAFSILSAIVTFTLIHIYDLSQQKRQKKFEYNIQFAYPIKSINPEIYDDWESVFIGNHIYYHFLPEANKPEIPYITEHISIRCIKPSKISSINDCKSAEVSFTPYEFSDCMGKHYTIIDIKNEFESLLNTAKWIIPNWKSCTKDKKSICVTGDYSPDLHRRLSYLNLRFGWIKANKADASFGAGPYCLYGHFDSSGNLSSGILLPNVKKHLLPKIIFHTSQSKNDQFHLALYGNKKLLNQDRKNISIHTPLAYYVISNPSLDQYYLPWNTSTTRDLINQHLTENELTFREIPNFFNFAPKGHALDVKTNKKFNATLIFFIPNYLPECQKLAEKLNNNWISTHAKAICGDVVTYVYHSVINKQSPWHGFLIGISSADKSRNSIQNEYFSPNTTHGLVYKHKHPEKLFYLVGIGQTSVTVDSKIICGIKPNPLGLGFIFITDLIRCPSQF